MKKFRKIMAVLVAAMMIMAMCTPMMGTKVLAATQHKITFNRDSTYVGDLDSDPETFTYWQILKADISSLQAPAVATGELNTQGTPGVVAYYVEDETLATALTDLTDGEATPAYLFDVAKTADGTRWNVRLKNPATTAAKIAERLLTLTTTGQAYASLAQTASFAESSDPSKLEITVDDGYYLFSSSLGDKLVIQTVGDVTINEKNKYPAVDKQQKESTGSYADTEVSVAIGDTIYYQSIVTVPATVNKDITLKDTMSAGLTPVAVDSVKVYYDTAKTGTFANELEKGANKDYTITLSGQEYTIVLKPTADVVGNYIKIEYTATVNADAVKADVDKKNTITLEYSEFKQSDNVLFNTKTTGAVKYDGSTATVSNGVLSPNPTGGTIKYLEASFKLQWLDGSTWKDVSVRKDGDFYRPIVGSEQNEVIKSDATKGQIIIRGLDGDKTYHLIETEAPTGYYKMEVADVKSLDLTADTLAKVSIDAATGAPATDTTYLEAAKVQKIENKKGVQLPATGGAGTTVLYIVGGMLIVLAGAYLFFSRKKTA